MSLERGRGGLVVDSRSRGRGFKPHSGRRVVLWLTGRHKGYIFERIFKFFSETVGRMKLKLGILRNFYCLIGDNRILFLQNFFFE